MLSAGGVAMAVVAATALLLVATQPVRLPHHALRLSSFLFCTAVQPQAGVSCPPGDADG